jgi:hypothetical protein
MRIVALGRTSVEISEFIFGAGAIGGSGARPRLSAWASPQSRGWADWMRPATLVSPLSTPRTCTAPSVTFGANDRLRR